MNKTTTLAVLVCLSASLSASTQDIEVTPEGGDYGDVRVGSSSTMIFTITSVGMTPLSVESVTIVDDATGSFSITSAAQAARSPALERRCLRRHHSMLAARLYSVPPATRSTTARTVPSSDPTWSALRRSGTLSRTHNLDT